MRFLPLLFALMLAGCGSVNLWPFGGRGTELSRTPPNATEYRCESGRGFWVRNLEDGAVWLIAPDREIRLAKAGAAGRYSAARVVLEISGDEAALTDPPVTFSGCKRAPKN
jgi:membrane-bound inhibitor of C-type lysozyme